MGRRQLILMGEDPSTGITAGEAATGAMTDAIANLPPELTLDAVIQTGQIMYQQGYATGQSKGLLYGALIGAALLMILK